MPTSPRTKSFYERRLKRPLDFTLALVLVVLLIPLFALVGLLVLITLGRPILFVDQRGGRLGRTFPCWKFRTMADLRDESGNLLPDAVRRTRFGDWLRGTSLDELPQLGNILRGEMSFVGPRPLTAAYLDRYTPEQQERHDVRPGLTGWAQVNGRTSISWERKFELDRWYVDHVSLRLDLKIIWLTLWQVMGLGRQSAGDHAEAEFVQAESRQA
jgi:lipopolysaccharide/colanic/teichoic acid biosynthesis glycosyltransferase